MDNLARNLGAFREAEGWSVTVFAALLGRDRPNVEGIERAEAVLTIDAIEEIAETLGIEPLLLLE
jgi:transcriptional regulator with XRE-family HTH domain